MSPGANVRTRPSLLRCVPPAHSDAAGAVAHSECHQCAAVGEVDAGPVPAGSFGSHDLARPFVIEPCAAGHGERLAVDGDRPRDSKLRPAVVEACLSRQRALARIATLPVGEHGPGGRERKLERESARGDLRPVHVAIERQRPVVDDDAGRVLARLRKTKALARCALVMPQPAGPGAHERRVREQQLPRSERARILFVHARPVAEERDLHAIIVARAVGEPSRHVPPLDAEIGMAAVVAREAESVAGLDRRIGARRQRIPRDEHERHAEEMPALQRKSPIRGFTSRP